MCRYTLVALVASPFIVCRIKDPKERAEFLAKKGMAFLAIKMKKKAKAKGAALRKDEKETKRIVAEYV